MLEKEEEKDGGKFRDGGKGGKEQEVYFDLTH